jgi:hypothetical protein
MALIRRVGESGEDEGDCPISWWSRGLTLSPFFAAPVPQRNIAATVSTVAE